MKIRARVPSVRGKEVKAPSTDARQEARKCGANAHFGRGNGRHHGHQGERQSSQQNEVRIRSLEIDFLSEKTDF